MKRIKAERRERGKSGWGERRGEWKGKFRGWRNVLVGLVCEGGGRGEKHTGPGEIGD